MAAFFFHFFRELQWAMEQLHIFVAIFQIGLLYFLLNLLLLLLCAQMQRDALFELCRVAFEFEPDGLTQPGGTLERRKGLYSKDYKRLGFSVSPWVKPL